MERIVEIAGESRHLSALRGFLLIEEKGEEQGRIPIEDIAAVIATARGVTFSNTALVRLAEQRAPLVVCNQKFMPAAFLLPLEGHYAQGARLRAQAEASKPLKKRLWRDLVVSKILNQAAVLEAVGARSGAFRNIARSVRPGDPDNLEAQAARRYWPLAFGSGFYRDRRVGGVNALLNYGYTVLRAAIVRAIVAAGLHPTLSLHHANEGNAFALADDLMEPFRPFVDWAVIRLGQQGHKKITDEVKAALAELMVLDIPTRRGTTPLMTCLHRLAYSLAQTYVGEAQKLDLPQPPQPLTLAQALIPGESASGYE